MSVRLSIDNEVDYLLNEIIQLEYNVNLSFEHIDRLTITHDSLNDYITSVDSNPSLESNVNTIVSLALAGSDFTIDNVSIESVGGLVKSIRKAIVDAIKKVFKYLSDLVNKVDIASTWLIHHVKSLERKRIAARGRTPSSSNITLGGMHRYLRVGTIFTDEPARLLRELKRYKDLVDFSGDGYVTMIKDLTDTVVKSAKGKEGDNLRDFIVKSINESNLSKYHSTSGMKKTERARFNYDGVWQKENYLGGKTLYYMDGNLELRGLQGLRRHGFRFSDTFAVRVGEADERDFVSLTTATMEGIPTILEALLRGISRVSNNKVKKSLKDIEKTLLDFTESNKGSMSEEDMGTIRHFTTAILSWTRSVPTPVFGNCLQVCRAVLSYGKLSISNLS